ncbi:MAG: hypothetical protein KJZ62_11055 [Fimbriimonadaceae bacterium]|nr:hypothetical protein [Fimbriimonadaceae bacterium]QOJ11169.1 MAG: hypothetical protein HRU74_03560 [Chthonomonadaceae bacterium]
MDRALDYYRASLKPLEIELSRVSPYFSSVIVRGFPLPEHDEVLCPMQDQGASLVPRLFCELSKKSRALILMGSGGREGDSPERFFGGDLSTGATVTYFHYHTTFYCATDKLPSIYVLPNSRELSCGEWGYAINVECVAAFVPPNSLSAMDVLNALLRKETELGVLYNSMGATEFHNTAIGMAIRFTQAVILTQDDGMTVEFHGYQVADILPYLEILQGCMAQLNGTPKTDQP